MSLLEWSVCDLMLCPLHPCPHRPVASCPVLCVYMSQAERQELYSVIFCFLFWEVSVSVFVYSVYLYRCLRMRLYSMLKMKKMDIGQLIPLEIPVICLCRTLKIKKRKKEKRKEKKETVHCFISQFPSNLSTRNWQTWWHHFLRPTVPGNIQTPL